MAVLTSDDKAKVKRYRASLGLFIAFGWILAWYCFLEADYEALGTETSGISRLSAGASVYIGTFVAVVTSPLSFIVSHYIARTLVEKERGAISRADELDTRAKARAEEEARHRRLMEAELQDRQTRIHNARSDLIDRLGSVTEFIELIARTTDANRTLLLEQNVRRGLREVISKYPLNDLSALIAGDNSLDVKVGNVLSELHQLNLGSEDAALLEKARGRAEHRQRRSANN